MKTTNEWWKQTANHIWRTYFAIIASYGSDPDNLFRLSNAERNTYNICTAVCNRFRIPSDIDILRMYYTTPKGMELANVQQFSADNNIPTDSIWNAVRHANRAVIEELGLLDRKYPAQNARE